MKYIHEGKIGDAVDNTIVTPGKGTDMEQLLTGPSDIGALILTLQRLTRKRKP